MIDHIKEFESWLIQDGISPKTIESYVGDVKGFQLFLNSKINSVSSTINFNKFSFVRYKEYLTEKKYKVSTINKKINSLLVYNKFLVNIRVVGEMFISLKKDKVTIAAGSEKEVTALSESEVERLLFYLEGDKTTLRNKLVFYLLLYTGLRVSELVGLKTNGIDLLSNSICINGKGGKIRDIPLKVEVAELIKNYIKKERKSNKHSESEYLLLSQRGEKLHRDAIRNLCKNTGTQLGIHLHPHLFRHTFCTRLLKRGVDLTTVSKLAGHSTINMTAKFYIQTSKEEKTNAISQL
jgi:site-specific recombinase XerD